MSVNAAKEIKMLLDVIPRPEGMELQYIEHFDRNELEFIATIRSSGTDYVDFTFDNGGFLEDIVIAVQNSQRAALKKAVEIAFELDPKIVLDFIRANTEPQSRETD